MNIQAFIPYHESGLKEAYKQCFDLLPNENDWAVLCDRDIFWFQSDFIEWIRDYIELYPNTGMFTTYASRCSYQWQIRKGTIDSHDMRYHVKQAAEIQALHPKVKEIDGNIAGHVMVMQKKTFNKMWKWLEKTPTLKNHEVLGVDTLISKWLHANKLPILLMRGLYVYHLFRLGNKNPNKAIQHVSKDAILHIITACSRPENLERIRKQIPKYAKWWIIYDRKTPLGIGDEEYQYDTENTWGKAQINFALDKIPLGAYCYVLDDDNILHPDFFKTIKPYLRKGTNDLIMFDSTQRKAVRKVAAIDQAQYIWKNNESRYPLQYDGDGHFVVNYKSLKPLYIEKVISFYNGE